jgi:hypothetical protein
MQTTFIVKNLTPEMIDGVNALQAGDAFAKLNKWATGDLRHCVTVKNGAGAFRDRVEWNQIMRRVNAGEASLAFKCEPRRGYKLFTFQLANASPIL